MADDVDKARIDALLHELRALDHGDPAPSVEALARRHRLDPMIVRRIAESEEIDLADEPGTPGLVDDEADTGPV
jgi:hypothetical protein